MTRINDIARGQNIQSPLGNIRDSLIPALREKMEVYSEKSKQANRTFSLYINPGEFRLNPGEKLINGLYTRTGKVYQHYLRSDYSNDDIPTITFSGKSGNVKKRTIGGLVGTNVGNKHGVSSRLFGFKQDAWAAFHKLQAITREPAFYIDSVGGVKGANSAAGNNITGTRSFENERSAVNNAGADSLNFQEVPTENSGYNDAATKSSDSVSRIRKVLRENTQYIFYKSHTFPDGILFKGHYQAPLEFDESADIPFIINYTFTFVVESSEPSLTGILENASLFSILWGDTGIIAEQALGGNIIG